MLPGLDGIEVCQRIQARPRGARAHAHRARQRVRSPRRARSRRRRLHDEAVQRARARRARARDPAPRRARVGRDRRRPRVASATSSSTPRRAACVQAGEPVHLTPTEFDLLMYLAARPGRVVDPRGVARAGVGLRSAVGRAHRRLARPLVAPQARRRRRSAPCTASATPSTTRQHRRSAAVRRPPERPLDPLPTLKLKLSVVILAAVAVTVVVFWAGVRIGVWPSVCGIIAGALALVVVWFLARGMTSPLREMVDGQRGDGARRLQSQRVTAPRATRSARSPARSTRWPPSSPRPTACAATSSPTSATSCARRSPRCRRCSRTSSTASSRPIPRRCARCSPRSNGSAAWCSSCSTSRGSSRARVPLDRRVVRGRADARARGARVAAARRRRPPVGRRSSPMTSRSRPTTSACTRSSRTSSRTRCGTRRPTATSPCARVADGRSASASK